jgi:hypothetical protein
MSFFKWGKTLKGKNYTYAIAQPNLLGFFFLALFLPWRLKNNLDCYVKYSLDILNNWRGSSGRGQR